MLTSALFVLVTSLSAASAVIYQGFNYAAGADFGNDFITAKALTSGFTSARLYIMIQQGTTNTPTAAIQAAIDTDTTLLLGLCASETQDAFNNELAALSSAISQYGPAFTNLIEPDTLVTYIGQVRSVLANANISPPVGHVDTYGAWINSAVTAAVDFIGMDAYPYCQNTTDNSIENANAIFFSALNQTIAGSAGKPVWIAETGWPVSGPTEGQAVTNIQNADILGHGRVQRSREIQHMVVHTPRRPAAHYQPILWHCRRHIEYHTSLSPDLLAVERERVGQ